MANEGEGARLGTCVRWIKQAHPNGPHEYRPDCLYWQAAAEPEGRGEPAGCTCPRGYDSGCPVHGVAASRSEHAAAAAGSASESEGIGAAPLAPAPGQTCPACGREKCPGYTRQCLAIGYEREKVRAGEARATALEEAARLCDAAAQRNIGGESMDEPPRSQMWGALTLQAEKLADAIRALAKDSQ